MPLTGFLGGFFGQKRVYLISMVTFVAASALCGTARSLPALIFFRVLQGFGGGALQPTQQAILRQTFPPSEQGMAMAIFSMVIMVGPAIGPVLGDRIFLFQGALFLLVIPILFFLRVQRTGAKVHVELSAE